MYTIGTRIALQRKISDISQEELAERLNVSRQTVSKWESDAVVPNTENLKALCEIFKVSPDFFLKEDFDAVLADATPPADSLPADNPQENKKAGKRRNIILATLISVVAVLLVFCITVVVVIVILTFSDNIGVGMVRTHEISNPAFIVCLAIGIALLAFFIALLILRHKK